MKKRLLVCITIMLMLSSACGSVEKETTPRVSNTSSEPKPETDKYIISNNISEPFVRRINLDSETEKSFYGTWKVEKLLGFGNSYNDASEYPTGQKNNW